MQRHIEMDAIDQPVRRTIILEADGTGLFGTHGQGEFLRACEIQTIGRNGQIDDLHIGNFRDLIEGT